MAGDSEQVKVIFQNWDRDGSGDISVAELTRVLKKLNPQFDQASCEKMFTSMDVNMDGTIQYDEFLNWLLVSFLLCQGCFNIVPGILSHDGSRKRVLRRCGFLRLFAAFLCWQGHHHIQQLIEVQNAVVRLVGAVV
mmetsp:Transcript_8701/g.10050  ORF Transcript_8701/g.10050 Transcript_8701/m.10050 type:complete len:136 (+) Transcript_8701:75-482(+)